MENRRGGRGERKAVEMDAAMEVILGERRERALTPGPSPRGRGEKGHVRPHDKERRMRQICMTLPSEDWVEAIREQAEQFGLRTSEFLVWCISQAMYGIKMEGERPEGSGQGEERIGEAIKLLWQP